MSAARAERQGSIAAESRPRRVAPRIFRVTLHPVNNAPVAGALNALEGAG